MFKANSFHLTLMAVLLVGPLGADARICNDKVEASAPDSRYNTHGDGTVTDNETGLMWKRCSEGQSWDSNNATCSDSAATYNWQTALQRAQDVNAGDAGNNLGHTDWRLPNKNELASLVEQRCYDPAINSTIFPGTLSSEYWTASPDPDDFAWATRVNFNRGVVEYWGKDNAHAVRLVRGGQ